jgi:hypothetical protein
MKLALMQPYFLPYIGYFQLIAAVDVFVVYDDVQFIKNGWINRNRILLNGSASWITLPVERGHLQDNINQRHFVNYRQACEKIMNQMDAAYRKAPFHSEVKHLVGSLLALEGDNVADILRRQLEQMSRYLSLSTRFLNSTDLTKQDAGLDGQDRVIEICKAVKASEYYNAIGGSSFISNLSIIDVLMFNRPEQACLMLKEFDLLDKNVRV